MKKMDLILGPMLNQIMFWFELPILLSFFSCDLMVTVYLRINQRKKEEKEKEGTEIITDEEEIANIFNNYFVEKIKKLKENIDMTTVKDPLDNKICFSLLYLFYIAVFNSL